MESEIIKKVDKGVKEALIEFGLFQDQSLIKLNQKLSMCII